MVLTKHVGKLEEQAADMKKAVHSLNEKELQHKTRELQAVMQVPDLSRDASSGLMVPTSYHQFQHCREIITSDVPNYLSILGFPTF